MPWVLGRAAYSFDLFGGKHMLAANAGYQRDKDQGTKDRLKRWLVGGEFKFDFGPFLLKGEAWTGEGIGGDFLRYDLDTFETSGGRIEEWEAWGGWADLTYKIIDRWTVTVGAGVDDPDNDDYERTTGNLNRKFKIAYNAYANTWWSLGPDVKVGFEFMHLQANREDATGEDYDDKGNRYTLSLYYGF